MIFPGYQVCLGVALGQRECIKMLMKLKLGDLKPSGPAVNTGGNPGKKVYNLAMNIYEHPV